MGLFEVVISKNNIQIWCKQHKFDVSVGLVSQLHCLKMTDFEA